MLKVLVLACTPAASPARPAQPAASAPGGAPAPAAQPATSAAPPVLHKVSAAYSSLSGSQMPIYLAVENGLFAKHGLEVEATYIASGTTALQSLLANEIQFTAGSGGEPTAAYLNGAPAQILLGWINTFPNLFMVDPSITSPEQLRGKPIGISRFGGQPHVGEGVFGVSSDGFPEVKDAPVEVAVIPFVPEIKSRQVRLVSL